VAENIPPSNNSRSHASRKCEAEKDPYRIRIQSTTRKKKASREYFYPHVPTYFLSKEFFVNGVLLL
jgi:hypothetical protein